MDSTVFRKSFKGYNREDVNAYIIKISRTVSEKDAEIASLKEKYEEMKLQKEAAETILTEESAKIEAAENEISDLKALCGELKAARDAAIEEKNEAAALREMLEEVQKERDSYRAQIDTDGEKARQYDSISGKLGEVMMKANAKAEEIILDAENKAKAQYAQMLDESKANVEELNEKYSGRLFDRTRELLGKLDEIVNESAVFRAEMSEALGKDIEKRKEGDASDDH